MSVKEFADHWNGIIGVADLLVGVVGFLITILAVRKATRAADAAAESARKTREALVQAASIADLSAAVGAMEEIKKLHRAPDATEVLTRYSPVRLRLSSVSTASFLSEPERKVIQAAITHLARMEKAAERSANAHQPIPDVPKTNSILSRQIDRLGELLTSLRNRTGAENG